MCASPAPHANLPNQSHLTLRPPLPPSTTPMHPPFQIPGPTPISVLGSPLPLHLTPATSSDLYLNSAGNRNSYQTSHSLNSTPTQDNAFLSSSHVTHPYLTFFSLPKSTQLHCKICFPSIRASHATTMTRLFTHLTIASTHPLTAIPSSYVAADGVETTVSVPPNGLRRYLVILQDTPPALPSSSHGFHKVMMLAAIAILLHPASATPHPSHSPSSPQASYSSFASTEYSHNNPAAGQAHHFSSPLSPIPLGDDNPTPSLTTQHFATLKHDSTYHPTHFTPTPFTHHTLHSNAFPGCPSSSVNATSLAACRLHKSFPHPRSLHLRHLLQYLNSHHPESGTLFATSSTTVSNNT